MTVTLADIATERMVRHCAAFDSAKTPYMNANPSGATQHLDPLRDDALAVLINKYAPFLSSRPSLAQQAVEPILNLIIDNFALDDMNVTACAQVDMTMEALTRLEPNETADVLTVFASRGAALDENETMLKPCPVDPAQ